MANSTPVPGEDDTDSDEAQDQLWDAQHWLTGEVQNRVEELCRGRSAQYKAGLYSYLTEFAAERLRMYLRLPESDARPAGEEEPGD